jgi:hypothetical protein
MKKKTKHIIIIILSVIVWLSLFFIPTHGDLVLGTIKLFIQLSLIFFGWYNSFIVLKKIKAATKLLELINKIDTNELNTYNGICSLILFELNEGKTYRNYVELLTPTKKQRLKLGNQSSNKSWWFKPYDWETRIKYLKSYL